MLNLWLMMINDGSHTHIYIYYIKKIYIYIYIYIYIIYIYIYIYICIYIYYKYIYSIRLLGCLSEGGRSLRSQPPLAQAAMAQQGLQRWLFHGGCPRLLETFKGGSPNHRKTIGKP